MRCSQPIQHYGNVGSKAIFWHQAIRSVLLLSSLLTPLYGAEQDGVLHQGTPVRMRIMRTVSSSDAQEGDKVDFQTLDEITLNGNVVIPKSATAIATVTVAEAKKRMARGGKLAMNIDYVQLPFGDKLPLRGIQNLKGGGHTGAMTGGMVVTAIVFWPAAPLLLFMHGKDVSIPEGQEITVYTNTDYKVGSQTSTSPTVGNKLLGPALTEADILKLKSAGLSDELLIQKINSAPAGYDVSTDELLRLKQAGLSDPVIGAMMTVATRH
jgi:hypothetical protein